jgi:hypothetical protein
VGSQRCRLAHCTARLASLSVRCVLPCGASYNDTPDTARRRHLGSPICQIFFKDDRDLWWGCLSTSRSWLPSRLFACLSLENIRSGKTLEHASKPTNLPHLCRNTSFHRYATRKFPLQLLPSRLACLQRLKGPLPVLLAQLAATGVIFDFHSSPPAVAPPGRLQKAVLVSRATGGRQLQLNVQIIGAASECQIQANDDRRSLGRSSPRRLIGGQIRSQHGSSTHLRFRQAGARRRSGISAQNSRAPWPTSAKSHLIGCGSVASAMGHAIRIADLQMSIHGNWTAQRPPSRSCRADTSTASNRYLTAVSDATWGSL